MPMMYWAGIAPHPSCSFRPGGRHIRRQSREAARQTARVVAPGRLTTSHKTHPVEPRVSED